jgi:TfoX/Sxy family transcriptional regulator of competence genes
MAKPATSKPKKPTRRIPARPTFPKSPASLIATFESALKEFPQARLRRVFGYPCAFVGGNMAVGLHADRFFVRLSPADQARLLDLPGAGYLEVMPGRPMRDYTLVPASVVRDAPKLRAWIRRAMDHCRTLPPKGPKAR